MLAAIMSSKDPRAQSIVEELGQDELAAHILDTVDAGPFVQALEYASGSQAELFGKPAPGFFQAALTELKAEPAQVIMIGDDVEADVQGALAAGLQAILVRTGKYTAGDEARLQGQGEVVADLTEAVELILGRWH